MLRKAVLSLALSALVVAPLASRAADPAHGTISAAHRSVSWKGGPLSPGTTVRSRSVTTPAGELSTPAETIGGSADHYTVTVALPKSYYKTHPNAVLRVRVDFDATSDLNVSVSGTDATGQKFTRSSSVPTGTFDMVTIARPANGDFAVTISTGTSKPSAASYTGTASLVDALLGRAAAPARKAPAFATNTIVDAKSAGSGEPSIAIGGQGATYVSVPTNGVSVYRSTNRGRSFGFMGDFDTDSADGGGGDSEIKVDNAGNVYIADLAVTSINVLKSTDGGSTFPQRAYTGYEADRQWLATYGPRTVYLAYHDFVAEDEIVMRSDDGGATFTGATSAIQDGGAGAYCVPNTFSGPIAVDQQDETVYVSFACSDPQSNTVGTGTPPFGPATQIWVGVSHDRGVTFTDYKVASFPPGASVANLFPSMTLDRAGNAYVVWAGWHGAEGGTSDVWLSASKDHGKSWSGPIKVNSDRGTHFMPWVAAGKSGKVDVVWIGTPNTTGDDPGDVWNVSMAQSQDALAAHPKFTQSPVSSHPIHFGQVCTSGILCSLGGDRSLLDFIEVAVDSRGMANVVWTENIYGPNHIGFARQSGGASVL